MTTIPALLGTTRLDSWASSSLRLAHESKPFHAALRIADLASPPVLVALTLLLTNGLLLRRFPRRLALQPLVATAAAGTLQFVLKQIVQRPPVPPLGSGYSFPSGHASGATALAVSLALVSSRRGLSKLGWGGILSASATAIAIAASRVLTGAHYLTDVVGGLALGIAVATAVHRVMTPRGREAQCPAFSPSTTSCRN